MNTYQINYENGDVRLVEAATIMDAILQDKRFRNKIRSVVLAYSPVDEMEVA